MLIIRKMKQAWHWHASPKKKKTGNKKKKKIKKKSFHCHLEYKHYSAEYYFTFAAVDTSAPDVLQIYEPTVLRYYQLYQTSPLNAVDVQLSYSTRSGDIFPIYLTAGSSASIDALPSNL